MFENFTFDGISSATHGIICVNIGSTGEDSASAGMETELTTESAKRSNKFYIVNQPYSAPISFTMQIMNCDGSYITPTKEQTLKKWLCQRGVYKWFQIDTVGYENICYNVNISNPQLLTFGGTIGMEFTVTTDAPYGYSPIITNNYEITSTTKSFSVVIDTDEDDYIYPTVAITMAESGNLQITNSTEVPNHVFTLNNVIASEVITIDSELPYISSSTSHNVFQDFNKYWLRFTNGTNTLTFNLNCTVTITYREIRKVGVYQ